jgi:hypothetical protein
VIGWSVPSDAPTRAGDVDPAKAALSALAWRAPLRSSSALVTAVRTSFSSLPSVAYPPSARPSSLCSGW